MSRSWFFVALCTLSCDPQGADWGLDAITTMKTPGDDPSLTCGAILPTSEPSHDRMRASCAYQSGAHSNLDPKVIAAIPIRHVIIVMKENRSFDHLLGKLHDRGQPEVEAVPATFSNPDFQGKSVFVAHASTTCIPHDPAHQQESMVYCINDGKMDGFVQNGAQTTATDGAFVMDEYDETDLPFDYWLARTFAVADRDFAPMATGTYANRNFLLFGTNAGVINTGIVYPNPRTPSIMQLLMTRGFTWGVYTDGRPFSAALDWKSSDPGVHPLSEFVDALDKGTLPSVAFVDGIENVDDDHPLGDVQRGEAWLKSLYDHVITSPQWLRLAMFWTYDEGGGFADHVPPPRGCLALPSTSPFTQLGPRIPLVAISPWAKRGMVSHVVRDHTAITRFIETIFDLPALTARDANSDALLDMFDFSCGRDLTVGAAPNPGTGGCPHPSPLGAD